MTTITSTRPKKTDSIKMSAVATNTRSRRRETYCITLALLLIVCLVSRTKSSFFIQQVHRCHRCHSLGNIKQHQQRQPRRSAVVVLTTGKIQHDRSLTSLFASNSNNDEIDEKKKLSALESQNKQQKQQFLSNRLRRLRRGLRKWTVTLFFSLGLLGNRRLGFSQPAHAKYAYEISEEKTHSLRPGMSSADAEALTEGKVELEDVVKESATIFSSPPASSSSEEKSKSKKSSSYDDYGDAYDEDDLDDEDLDDDPQSADTTTTSVASQSDVKIAERMKQATTNSFASAGDPSARSDTVKFKVGVAFFLPTGGFMVGREYVRRRREERYVEKGLEILAAQKAEYFNVTDTKAADSDVQDALKGLKKNETNTDDDDDDDDDYDGDDEDDDDDEPPPSRPSLSRGPKKPLGDGDGSSGGTGGGNSSGDEPPDLDMLNKMFNKS